MQRGGEAPLWPDATTRYPVLIFSHGYRSSPLSNDHLYAMTVFASFGYVVAAPFHADATFSDLKLEDFGDVFYLLTHLENFLAMQALRPLALSATIDLLLAQPQWRDRVDAAQIGGFGASMGGESLLLMAGAGLTTSIGQSWTQITNDPRLKAAVGVRTLFRTAGPAGVRARPARARRRDAPVSRHQRHGRHDRADRPGAGGRCAPRRHARARRALRREARLRRRVDRRHLHVVGHLSRRGGARRSRGAREAAADDERGGRRRRPRAHTVQRSAPAPSTPVNFGGLWWNAPGRLGVGLGHQLRAPGRRDLRDVAHLRSRRQARGGCR